MKLSILHTILALLALVRSQTLFYKYTEGQASINDLKSTRVSGSYFFDEIVVIKGMDINTMTPFLFYSKKFKGILKPERIEAKAECAAGIWSNIGETTLKGTVTAVGKMEKLVIEGNCTSTEMNQHWKFKMEGHFVLNPYYHGKEAGLRARYLIGHSGNRYPDFTIPSYAIYDYPYNTDTCMDYRRTCSKKQSTEPGLVIIDKIQSACGILDNEGDKIIYADPDKGVVVATPLALSKKHFPNGYDLYECATH